MNFLEWNNHIAKHFFNPNQAGRDIHLFITKQEIINLAKENFEEETDQEIWEDYLRKLRNGLPGSSGYPDIFDKAIHSFQQWKKGIRKIDGVEVKYPPYISHLVFAVLPLIEIQGDYYATNYYDRLKDFLNENNIQQNLRNKLRDIDELWADLSNWSINTKNGELGCFKELLFTHETRKFVYKPFSQCVLTPKAIRKLSDFFYATGFVPKTFYQDEFFKQQLCSRNGIAILELKTSVVEIIKKPADEIGQSIIETVKSEFIQWTGEEHEIVLKDGIEKKIRKNTVVPLKLQFKVNEDGEIVFSYRVKYSSEPPPELKFDEFEDIYENKHWSRTLKRNYKDSFELKDTHNKWKAVFDFKNIRLLIRGGYFQLGNDFFIETEKLSRVEEMYLLCKNNISQSIQNWCENCCSQFRNETTLINVPPDHSLFWFKNPHQSHTEFPQLKVYENKTISLRAGTGLKISYLSYLNEMLPEVEISNADGNEKVYIQYENENEKFFLDKHSRTGGIWLLPQNITVNKSFYIQIENGFIEGARRTYKIGEASHFDLSNENLHKRNKFNAKVDDETTFIQGNRIVCSFLNEVAFTQTFINNQKATILQGPALNFKDNTLLKWLIGVKECDIKKYNEAFETILHKTFEGEQLRLQERRKSSLNILDYLGYVDFNYSDDKIFTLPPKLISIPSDRGIKALLIGGRDEEMVNEMIAYCSKSNNRITISFKKQSEKNLQMLIPDSIIFETNNKREFENLANHFQIEFDDWYILKLKNFLPTLSQYEQYTIGKGSSESWEKFGLEKKIFRKESLKFELVNGYDKEYSLTECRPSYIPEFALWIKQSYYPIDKNWGKYLFINNCSEKVRGYGYGIYFSKPNEIFCNSKNLAIPVSIPLPKFISRLILQLSGEAPEFKQINLKGKSVSYNVYRNIPSLFTHNFFQAILDMKIETTMQAI
ncbi:MAG: hypothetical protein EOO44_00090 [Flavobacterium sp.]|nr:MAG: hypothetical protein EOO44_00090 [Flavobacterium sp.]